MNGKTWRIALCTAILEYGEKGVTGKHVADVANDMFDVPFPAWPEDAEWELKQFRKHLKFLREPGTGPAPSVYQQLIWALTVQLKPTHWIVRSFREFLDRRNCRNLQLQGLRNVRKSFAQEFDTPPRKKWRVHPEGRRLPDTLVARGDGSRESNAGFFK